MGGGTILLPRDRGWESEARPLRSCFIAPGLDAIEVDADAVVIGAMVPIAALTDAPDEVLADVARQVADAEIRRTATIGGNIAAQAAADAQRGDLGAPLIALGARVRSTGSGGERVEPIEEFLASDKLPGGSCWTYGTTGSNAGSARQVSAGATRTRSRSRPSLLALVPTAAICG